MVGVAHHFLAIHTKKVAKSARMGSAGTGGLHGIPPTSEAFAQIMIAMYIIAIPLNLVLLVAYLKHRRELLVHTLDHLFLLIVALHLGWCILYAWLQNYITLFRHGYDDSPTSDILCQASGVVLLEISGNAIMTHVLIATERWLSVVWGLADTRSYLIAIAFVLETMLAVMAAVQTHSTRRFEPTESGLYCFFPFVAADGDYRPLLGTIIGSAYAVMTSTAILCSYAYIYVK
ncbi:hypothetical protein HK101_005830, partial [Irineochytrium annulatum]